LSCHTLGVEILRYTERHKVRVPREARVCRFCRLGVENESHALLTCTTPALVAMRYQFLGDVYRLIPDFHRNWAFADDCLRELVQCRNFDVVQRLAKYTYEVLAVFATHPVFRPAEYLFNFLE
ncbi:hypothetical protein DFH06DRAFT_377521, partial [Mycena polygramma]